MKFIRGVHVDIKLNYLFVLGYHDGEIVVYDIKKPGRESEAKEVSRYRGKPLSREVCWSTSRGEFYVGNQDGTITIWDAKTS